MLLLACAASSDPAALAKAGESALGRHDAATAASNFESALLAIQDNKSHALYVRLQMGMAEALAGSSPGKCSEILRQLLQDQPGRTRASEFLRVFSAMAESRAPEAQQTIVDCLAFARPNFPDQEAEFEQMQQYLQTKSGAPDDADSNSAMAGLGYVTNQ